MDADRARTFLAIVHSGSFLKAADRLHVTQTTVSARIRTPEGRTGTATVLSAIVTALSSLWPAVSSSGLHRTRIPVEMTDYRPIWPFNHRPAAPPRTMVGASWPRCMMIAGRRGPSAMEG
jgi:Bacterial regulatory helix-turn-helix protein, lysR family